MADFPDIPSALAARQTPTCMYLYARPLTSACLCIGSRCHRWVPETQTAAGHSIGLRDVNEKDTVSTGRGVCADNLRAFPWDDPAGVERG